MRRALLIALTAAAVLPATASARPCAGADRAAAAAPASLMRSAVLCLVNHARGARGLPGLREDPRLDRSAQGWTDHLVAAGQFTHGSDFAARISAAGFEWQSAGENIAFGYPTPRAVVRAWMASTGHCENILDPQFAEIGIGVSRHALWTQDFALGLGHAAPSGNWAPAHACPD